jgi:hypothetical protein
MVHELKEKEKGEGKEMGRLRTRERGEGKRYFLLKLFSNHFFSKFQNSLKQETMHSNHDAQSLIVSNFI